MNNSGGKNISEAPRGKPRGIFAEPCEAGNAIPLCDKPQGILAKKGEPIHAAWLWTAWLTALIAVLCLFAANLVLGNLNQDEGWYLYAAKMVASGKMPYRDFAFTQGPVMPLVYSLLYPAIQSGGLAAGRLITAVLALASALIAAILAGRLSLPGQGRLAAAVCFFLALVNVYQIYFCTVVKTYSLAMFFLTGAFLTLSFAMTRRNGYLTMLAAALMVLAAGTRSSAAFVLPIVFCLLWLERRKLNFAGWAYFILGGVIASILIIGPFLFQSPMNFIYFAGRFHTLRHEGDLFSALIFKAGFISRVLQAYFVCFVFWAAAMVIRRSRQVADNSRGDQAQSNVISSFMRRCIWISAIAVSLVHLGAPFPYDDYQVFIYPLIAISVSLMIVEEIRGQGCKWVMLATLCLALSSAVSSPLNQEWIIEGRDLIWWRTKDKPPLLKLRETAGRIKSHCRPGDLLLTQDPYLAVETGCALPRGLELGQFSYFPALTRDQADKMNVLNRDTFAELLQNCNAPIAAFSGYAFAIQAPQITPVPPADKLFFEQIVSNRYELFDTVPAFGQASTELRLYRRK